jgi:hypothetical protein
MSKRFIPLCMGLMLIVLWIPEGLTQEMVLDGLVGFWSLDQNTITGKNVKDVFGGHDGTIKGAPKKVAGKFGDALEFDGETTLIEIPHHAELDLKNEVTIEFWFLLKGKSVNNDFPRPVSKGQSTGDNDGYGVWVRDTSSPNDIGFRCVTLVPTDTRSQAVPNYDDNNWHHVVLSYNGKKGRLYVDGEMLVDQDVSGDMSQSKEPLHIGDGRDERHWNGLIDEVRVYNRGLSEKEVSQNFTIKSNQLPVEAKGKLAATWGQLKRNF